MKKYIYYLNNLIYYLTTQIHTVETTDYIIQEKKVTEVDQKIQENTPRGVTTQKVAEAVNIIKWKPARNDWTSACLGVLY